MTGPEKVAADFEPWVSAKDVVEAVKPYGVIVSAFTLMKMARAGLVPSRKMGGQRRFRVSHILKHFDDHGPTQGE